MYLIDFRHNILLNNHRICVQSYPFKKPFLQLFNKYLRYNKDYINTYLTISWQKSV